MNIKLAIIALVFVGVLGGAATAFSMTDQERLALIAQIQQQIYQLQQQLAQLSQQPSSSVTPPASTVSWCHSFLTNLGYANSETSEVANLHEALRREGISIGGDADTIYSTGTARAVAEFQTKYNISPQSGYFGILTRTKMNALHGCAASDITGGGNVTPGIPFTPPPSDTNQCASNWQCGNWTNCFGGKQSRSCTDLNRCKVPTNKPATSQACYCQPKWECGNWGLCQNAKQSRSCTDTNRCGLTYDKPDTTRACICIPKWQCGKWSKCVNGVQTLTCTDANRCGIDTDKPETTQACGN